MTTEEIMVFLDIEPGTELKSEDIKSAFSSRLDQAKLELSGAGSKPARMMARDRLKRLESNAASVDDLVLRLSTKEEARKLIGMARDFIARGVTRRAVVPYRRLVKLPLDLLEEDLQMQVEDLGVELEDVSGSSEKIEEDVPVEKKEEVPPPPVTPIVKTKNNSAVEETPPPEPVPPVSVEIPVSSPSLPVEPEPRPPVRTTTISEPSVADNAGIPSELRTGKSTADGEKAPAKSRKGRAGDEKKAGRAASAQSVSATADQLLGEIEVYVSKGDFARAASALVAALGVRREGPDKEAWNSGARQKVEQYAIRFAKARMNEAREAQKSGYRQAVESLADLAGDVLQLVEGGAALLEECTRIKMSGDTVAATWAKSGTSCTRLTIEYIKGDINKRRLHILSLPSATFGRSSDADVTVRVLSGGSDINKYNRILGRLHFTLENCGNSVMLVDGTRGDDGSIAPSKNGVFVNGNRIGPTLRIDGSGTVIHAASRMDLPCVAHWNVDMYPSGDFTAGMPAGVQSLQPSGRWPSLAGMMMTRLDEMPEDVLFVWGAVPLRLIDEKLSPYWLIRGMDRMLFWNGSGACDVAGASGRLKIISLGKLSYIGK